MFQVNKTDISEFSLKEIDNTDSTKESELYYMQDVVQNILNLNIKDFNYIVFEEDLDNMYKTEFNVFFDEYMIPLITQLDEYLSIDIEMVQSEPYRTKHAFVKNIVRFIMNTLPYIYMKEYLHDNQIDGFHDALDAFDTNVKQNIVSQIEKSKEQYNSFNSMMSDIEETITNEKKKNKFNDMLSLLDASMNNKTKLLDYYISIINDSGEEGLQKLFKIYLKNDLHNII